jgi:membrane-associated protein
MTALLRALAGVPPWVLLLVVFTFPALEASTLLGVVVPGEIAVLLGGVFAHEGRVPLSLVMAAAALGAVVGDSVGYLVGSRLGPALLARASETTQRRLGRAQAFVERYGGPAVLLGRWVAMLRALLPSVAGAGGMPYRRFVAYNVVGGTLWAVTVAGVGFLAGAAYARAERYLGWSGLLIAMILVIVALIIRRRTSR